MIDVRPCSLADSPAADLIDAMIAELDAIYEPGSMFQGPSATPADFSPPTGSFIVLYEDGEPVACGGVKRFGAGCAEIKRMYVVPAARSRGVARRLLVELEAECARLGYRLVRLDTGARQPHAKALYESAGYVPIADYNGNRRASYWFEKRLDGRDR